MASDPLRETLPEKLNISYICIKMYHCSRMRTIAKRIVALLAACVMTLPVLAQAKDDSKPYNLQKAYEVLKENHDEEQALELLEEQLKSTPDNVECWMLMCRIYRNQGEYGRALNSVNEAIKVNKPKKSGYFNSTLYWWKASVYDDMDNTEQTVEWLNKSLAAARKDNKKNVQSILFDLGQAYYDLKKYDESDAIYRQMVKVDETDQAAMTGLARNMIARGDYAGAVKMLDAVQKFGEDYSGTYKFRSEAYDKMGETDKAIDDVLIWYEKDEDAYESSIVSLMMKHRTYALAKAKTMMKSSERKPAWEILLLAFYEEGGDYENAIKSYDALERDYGKNEFIYAHRASCYDELGLTDIALREIDKAIDLNPDYSNICTKAGILRTAGRYAEAVDVFDQAIDVNPSRAFAYYAKGWCYELSGDDDKAMECYDLGIDLNKDFPYIYHMRGQIYLKRGDKVKADEDFNRVLQLDTTVTDGSCRQYALHYLGRNEEADQWIQKLIDDEPYKMGHYYDKACLYSRMGRTDEAVKALETALEMGYCAFPHIEHDDDLDAVRDRDDFKALIEKYKAKLAERIERMGLNTAEAGEVHITEVPITKKAGGTFNVDCVVNGLSLNMIFDTGASDVTISKVEADFMLKNNYLSKEDIKGKKYYQVADGGIAEGAIVTLKEVKIGDAVLRNVDAAVVKSQKAPLLLGESVLQKFGTFTVDNINSKLIIKH